MPRVKVFHLVEDLKLGGMEQVIASLALHLDKTHFDVSVFCVSRGGVIAEDLIRQGVRVEILGIMSYFDLSRLLKLILRLRIEKVGIIHTHGYFAGVVGRIAGLLAQTEVIIHHVHSTYYGYRKRHFAIERLLGTYTKRVVCCSGAVANHVQDREKIPAWKCDVIYNGIPEIRTVETSAETLKQQFNILTKEPVIGTVANLFEHKGHAYLMQAARIVLDHYPSVKFLLVGDGPMRPVLQAMAGNLRISSSIIFAGRRQDIPVMLNLMDIFVLPSSGREGLGISIIEAMAAGKPAIGTILGGIPEVIEDNVTGLLVPPANHEALAGAILSLLGNRRKCAELGENGRTRYQEKFTEKLMLRKIETLYDSFLRS
jgi:glycosyltransferase involved in cell wall biosynthesis